LAKYLKHLVAESSKPLPAFGLMLDCRLKFNCLITGEIYALRTEQNSKGSKKSTGFLSIWYHLNKKEQTHFLLL
jgi:hypothetical protein